MSRRWRFSAVVVVTGFVLAGCAAVLGIDDVGYLLSRSDAGVGGEGGPGASPDACIADPDLDRDPLNCGACGHACGGSACERGECQPIPFPYAADDTPKPIAVTGEGLYVGHYSDDGGIVRFNLDGGGGPAVLARGYSGYVAIARGRLYYTTWAIDGALWSVPINGGEAARREATITEAAFSLFLREEDRHLIAYVGRYGAERGIWSVDLDIPDAGLKPIHTSGSPTQIATDGTRIYWVDQEIVGNTGVWSYDPTLKVTRQLVMAANKPYAVAVDREHVYYSELNSVPPRISRVRIDSSGPVDAGELVTPLPTASPKHLVARDGFLWIAGGISIYRLTLGADGGGGSLKVIASGLGNASQLVLDENFIYWTEENGKVQKIRRPRD